VPAQIKDHQLFSAQASFPVIVRPRPRPRERHDRASDKECCLQPPAEAGGFSYRSCSQVEGRVSSGCLGHRP